MQMTTDGLAMFPRFDEVVVNRILLVILKEEIHAMQLVMVERLEIFSVGALCYIL